jgi:hypothetical protein
MPLPHSNQNSQSGYFKLVNTNILAIKKSAKIYFLADFFERKNSEKPQNLSAFQGFLHKPAP